MFIKKFLKKWTFQCFFMGAALISLIISVAAGLNGCANKEVPKIKVGMGEAIITPQNPVGVPMAGYSRKGPSTGVHDDLYARSLVIEGEDGASVVLMTVALVNLNGPISLEGIRAGIKEKTGIPENNILISCTHTHSGPSIWGAGEEYQKFVQDRCVESAVNAWETRVPGRIGTGSTVCLDLGKNDRRMEYGGLHPDPEVAIIKVEDARGKLIGVAFNYGCHPSTLDLHNLEFTEDWPYYSIKGIKEKIGDDVWVAYYQSAQGDVKVGYTAELSAVGAEMGIRNFWYAEHKGRMMIDPVVNALPNITTSGNPVIKTARMVSDFPLREEYPITAKEAERRDDTAKKRLADIEKNADSYGKRVLDRARVDVFLTGLALGCAKWVETHPNPEPLSMEQMAIRIGDAVFVTFPNEVFTEIGLAVKERSP
ncbi:MAG: neutral/alkaline non-lysosomal ceramidase N-terminal domain-containing protein, partial [Candidatus Latescibacteria bacterium]|nr:neutral/alkaline non-lysosomal ceramidase N-terminal domain-containing protein [Candidatus Latescibacterota bacterium]